MKSFVEELSMSKHEEFEELCALAATGELSPEEELRFSEHLDGCPSCRAAYKDFSAILRELPASGRINLNRDVVRHLEETGFRDKFFARARAEGRRFSPEIEQDTSRLPSRVFRWFPAYQPIAIAAMVLLLLGVVGDRSFRSARSLRTDGVGTVAVVASNGVAAEKRNASLMKRISDLELENGGWQKTASELKAQNVQLLTRVGALEKELVTKHTDSEDLKRMVTRLTDANSQLASQLDQNTAAMNQTRGELEKAHADKASVEIQLQEARDEIGNLSQQVRAQAVSIEKDKELLMASRDITNLMGARNLHIIDVHDADGQGKDKKATGRVFYTEGKSLVFYAYDLDEKRLTNAKYTLEAWGERLGQPTSVKSLGILYVDDKAQKRWTLRVDDPRQLAHIDSVFVTLEPQEGGSERPRGRKILYAFLSGQANHP